jgi:hypothetical protein
MWILIHHIKLVLDTYEWCVIKCIKVRVILLLNYIGICYVKTIKYDKYTDREKIDHKNISNLKGLD